METKKSQKNKTKYYCVDCDYLTFNKYDFCKHELTRKHRTKKPPSNVMVVETENAIKSQDELRCGICKRKYKSKSGLWKHMKKHDSDLQSCNKIIVEEKEEKEEKGEISEKDIFLQILKDNKEMRQLMKDQQETINKQQNQISELIPRVGDTNNNFNLNIFLNETCKNAINFSDFLNSISLEVGDLLNTKDLGYVNGISNIFIKGLKQLNMHERPIHCSNIKNEVLYIKDDNKWEKEEEGKVNMNKAISVVNKKQIEKIKEWEYLNPNWHTSENGTREYTNIVRNIMGGMTDDECNKSNSKIIKTIAKEVIINK